MKKTLIALLLIVCLFAVCGCKDNSTTQGAAKVPSVTLVARFMTNVGGTEVTLQSGKTAISDSVLFYSENVVIGKPVTQPGAAPTRQGYLFAGWAVDKAGTELWDFSTPLNSGITFYAKWVRDPGGNQEETYEELQISFKEVVDDTGAELNITGVCNAFVSEGSVGLTTAAIKLLTANASNVKELLNYTVKTGTVITSATYSEGEISVDYTAGGSAKNVSITVNDVTAAKKVDNDTYESKAKNYEKNVSIKPYSVILAGSSSMEYWTTSTEDMAPITTANVGIGGTTAEQWTNGLAERLVFPYNPRTVVFYVGINNVINSKQSGEQTGAALVALFDKVHKHLPNTAVHFVLMNKVPGYTAYYDVIDTANGIVEEYAKTHDFLQLIDAGKGLVKPSGVTNAAYFLSDGLHMSSSGYVIWGAEVRRAVIEYESNVQKEQYND